MKITPNDLKDKSYSYGLGVTLIILGTIMIFVTPKSLIKFLFVVIGICLIVHGLLLTVLACGQTTWGLIEGIAELIIGTACIFYHQFIFTTIVGAFMIAIPVIKAFFQKKEQVLPSLKRSLPLMIMGLVLILSSQSNIIGQVLFITMGSILDLIGIYYLIPSKYTSRLFNKKQKSKVDKEDAIDVEAD